MAELVAKGKPRKITKGEMIYFFKSDVNRIMGDGLVDDESVGLIVEEIVDAEDILTHFSFKETLIKRMHLNQDEEVYHDKVLTLSHEIYYGRSKGDPETQRALKPCGVISAVHGKLYLDDDGNLLYQNLGANKSKLRGIQDQSYNILEQNDVGVLIAREKFTEAIHEPNPLLVASIKLGYQLKPHFVVRISVTKKANG